MAVNSGRPTMPASCEAAITNGSDDASGLQRWQHCVHHQLPQTRRRGLCEPRLPSLIKGTERQGSVLQSTASKAIVSLHLLCDRPSFLPADTGTANAKSCLVGIASREDEGWGDWRGTTASTRELLRDRKHRAPVDPEIDNADFGIDNVPPHLLSSQSSSPIQVGVCAAAARASSGDHTQNGDCNEGERHS